MPIVLAGLVVAIGALVLPFMLAGFAVSDPAGRVLDRGRARSCCWCEPWRARDPIP